MSRYIQGKCVRAGGIKTSHAPTSIEVQLWQGSAVTLLAPWKYLRDLPFNPLFKEVVVTYTTNKENDKGFVIGIDLVEEELEKKDEHKNNTPA